MKPAAIIFEMLEPRHASLVTDETRRSADNLANVLEWEERGWPDFGMYYPIFAAAPDALIFGAALTRGEVRRAMGEGAAEVFGAGAERFGLHIPVEGDDLTVRRTLQQTAHCNALPEEMLPGMIEAQRLRDAALARATVRAFEAVRKRPDRPQVVVIAGNGHVRDDWGVPAMLRGYFGADLRQDISIVSVSQYEVAAPDDPPVTFWTVTEAVDRTDPCAAFK